VDDDDEEEEVEKEKTYLPTSLDQALATAFTYDSANPDIAATASTSAQAQVYQRQMAPRVDCRGRHAWSF
jgi:hypothetical protein